MDVKRCDTRRRRNNKKKKKKKSKEEEEGDWCIFPRGVLSNHRNSCSSATSSGPPAEQGHSDMDLVSKPRSKSLVWLYFGLKADEKGQPLNSGEAICRLCRKIVLAKGGNTTNLRSHLRRRHRADFFETPSSTSTGALFEAQGD